MTRALPDTNVLLALAWPNHQFHEAARRWFASFSGQWLTCAVTQLGFVRLSSNLAFTRHAKTPHEAALLLRAMVSHPRHGFLEGLPSPAGADFEHLMRRLQGHQQVTDAYLLFLAGEIQARVVTFDYRLAALAQSQDVVQVLSMVDSR